MPHFAASEQGLHCLQTCPKMGIIAKKGLSALFKGGFGSLISSQGCQSQGITFGKRFFRRSGKSQEFCKRKIWKGL